MDRKEIEREVRAALKDWKRRDVTVRYVRGRTAIELYGIVEGVWFFGSGETNRMPGDEYDERVGYEIALERAINDAVNDLVNFYANREAHKAAREKRKAECAAPRATVPTRKKAVAVSGDGTICKLWCEPEHIEKVKAIPSVRFWLGEERTHGGYYDIEIADPRYDRSEVIRAIEAVGNE